MLGRSGFLTPAVFPLALLVLAVFAGGAQAHRLDAQVFLLPDKKVQVESWFSDGTAAAGAQVQVYGSNGQLLSEGRTDGKGIFVCSLANMEPLSIVVSAAGGHRKEVRITGRDLAEAIPTGGAETAGDARTTHSLVPLAERSSSLPLKDLLIGVGFLLALGAFVLSLRNAGQLRKLIQAQQLPFTPPPGKPTR
jgi:hypothetical protein